MVDVENDAFSRITKEMGWTEQVSIGVLILLFRENLGRSEPVTFKQIQKWCGLKDEPQTQRFVSILLELELIKKSGRGLKPSLDGVIDG